VTLDDFREAYLRATEFMNVHSEEDEDEDEDDGDGGHR